MREQVEALAGQKGAILVAMAGTDGNKLAVFRLDSPPVFDGMAAANGRLFMSTMDGKVSCLGPNGGTSLSRTDVEMSATQFKTTAPTPLPQSDSAPARKGKGKGKRKQ